MTAAEGLVSNEGNTSEEVKADDEAKIDKNAQMMSPVEESDEAVTAKVLPSPSPPSRQEMLEHNITHMPFRNWCPHCLAGKAKSTKHMQGAGLGVSETQLSAWTTCSWVIKALKSLMKMPRKVLG